MRSPTTPSSCASGVVLRPAVRPASEYRGPYASTASVTLVIARQLRREIERRHTAILAAEDDGSEAAAIQLDASNGASTDGTF